MFKLKDALSAVANKPEFSVKDRGGYTVIDYNLNTKTTFVGKDDAETTVLLNLRGTTFDNETGDIIRLGYHKFFNFGEFPEVDKALDFSERHEIKVKLDGSCIFPIYSETCGFELGTRAGVTDVSKMATAWMKADPQRYLDYKEFIYFCRKEKATPIFEYCSRENRVVIDHPVSSMILTGVRMLADGRYLDYAALISIHHMFNMPIVKMTGVTTKEKFAGLRELVGDLVNDEGIVIQFANGHMLKIKSADYCLKHKALDSLKFEKDVLQLALEGKIDDVLPLLDDDTKTRVQVHVATFMTMFYETHRKIMNEFFTHSHIESQKEFALAIQHSDYKSFLFSFRVGKKDLDSLLTDYCIKQCGTQEKTKEMKKFLDFDLQY